MDHILQQIRHFADKAHDDQMRRYSDDRYIVHPERVMELCREATNDITVLSAALLHDVLEDTRITDKEVEAFLQTLMPVADAARTTRIVQELTDVYTKNNYPQWNRRKRRSKEAERLGNASPEAQTIKYADIIDNCPEIVREDPDFGDRYISECRELLRRMTKGNPKLYGRAVETVNNSRKQLREMDPGL